MRAYKIGILTSAAIAIGTVSFFFSSDDKFVAVNENQCTERLLSDPFQCMNAEQESGWMSWITGDSRSAQFHYLDLLELLTRADETKKARSLSPKF